ncbi:MAG: SH3 domain-containing protein [Candidatus Omnitrophota bacterium]|nr:SH3 domain-containing protein [Candidatus Omnitrophota bacterium]
MKTAGFWIGRHPDPDKMILSGEAIGQFNADIRERLKLTKDLRTRAVAIDGLSLKVSIDQLLLDMATKEYFLANGQRAQQDFFTKQRENVYLDGIPLNVEPRFGLIAHYADQRFFPTSQGLYAQAFDIDFDELQNSALDVGTPVVVRHQSADGQWVYVEADRSEGWVEAKNMAMCSREKFREFLDTQSFIVATDAKADIFLDSALRQHYDSAHMGTKWPLVQETDTSYAVSLPLRDDNGQCAWQTGYIAKTQAHRGFLVYTPRTIYQQAFKLLNAPYGWGGMYGERDCSKLIQEVFATVGLILPRDSKNQIRVGRVQDLMVLKNSDKEEMIEQQAQPAITLLGLKGHIMLYLGTWEGRAYGIHAIWAYRQQAGSRDDVFVLNRVALSDLSLGAGSHKGSLADRIISFNILDLNP